MKQTNMEPNKVLEIVRSGKTALSINMTPLASPKIAELIGLTGFDCIWIDCEHQDFSDTDVFAMCLACRSTGITPLVRIRRQGRHSCFRGFEVGGRGIMVPHCMGEEDARSIVQDSKFAPLGLRGMDGADCYADYGLADMKEYMQWSNRESFVMVQIEDRQAVEEVDQIAATPGIDALFVGPGDLSQSYGVPLQFDHPLILEAYKKTAEASKRHGKFWGAPALGTENAKRLIDLGAQFLNCESSMGILRDGFKKNLEEYRKFLK